MEEERKIANKIWKNILFAIILMMLFISVNILSRNLETEKIDRILKKSSIVMMIASIIIFEIAYKRDKGTIAITGIEILIFAMYTLSITHIVELYKFNFNAYILMSSYMFAIYFVLKSIIIYTNEKRKYLKSLSDIKDIVTNEPIKKEPKKTEK